MSKPWIHAESSAKKYGGKPEDYIEIHNLMDSSKGAIPDNRHRALTHTSWFLSVILEKIFGITIKNSDDKIVSVRDIGEQHIMEDYGGKFIPTAQDFLQNLGHSEWMNNGDGNPPSSCARLVGRRTKQVIPLADEAETVETVTTVPTCAPRPPRSNRRGRGRSSGPEMYD